MDRYAVIDADGHVVEPEDLWKHYLDKRFADRSPQLVRDNWGGLRFMLEGRLWPIPTGRGAGRPEGVGAFYDLDSPKRREGGWDAQTRLRDMDAEGIDVMVLYPSLLLMGIATVEDPEFAEAVCQAYNNWLADHCRATPARLIGVAVVPLCHPEVAAREARRAVRELGFRGVMVHPALPDSRTVDHPDFDRFYAEVQDLGVPLAFHEGGGGHEGTLGSQRYRNYILTHAISHSFEQMAACASMIVGGVLERFPRLQVAFLEGGSGWLPFWLDRLDEHVERLHHLAPSLTLLPSEYFQRQCWISCDPDDRTLATVVELCGDDRIVWASDYPHLDAREGPLKKFYATQTRLSETSQRKILHENPRRLYGI
jgi:predicted TIM-barrel fold metal-dependent hydrolase